jgi:hypothetical protein
VELFMPYIGSVPRQGRDLLLRGEFDDALVKFDKECTDLPNLSRLLTLDAAAAAKLFEKKDDSSTQQDWIKALSEEAPEMTEWLKQQLNADLPTKLDNWIEKLRGAQGAGEDRAQLAMLIAEGPKLWIPYVEAITADERARRASYQLALCRHEKAERLAGRLGSSTSPADQNKLRDSWAAADAAWGRYVTDYPRDLALDHARYWRARAKQALGQIDLAVELLTQQAEGSSLTETDRLARAVRARQMKEPQKNSGGGTER